MLYWVLRLEDGLISRVPQAGSQVVEADVDAPRVVWKQRAKGRKTMG